MPSSDRFVQSVFTVIKDKIPKEKKALRVFFPLELVPEQYDNDLSFKCYDCLKQDNK